MDKFKVISFVFVSFIFGLLSAYYYNFFSPTEENLYSCTIKNLTGYDCPGCGGQRAFYYFLHGDFVNSFKMNPLFVFILGIVFYYLYVIIYNFLSNENIESFLNSKLFIFIFLIGIVLFGIFRNIY